MRPGGFVPALRLIVTAGLALGHRARRPPPLVVGKGGKDGETGDLAEFLQLRLDPGWGTS